MYLSLGVNRYQPNTSSTGTGTSGSNTSGWNSAAFTFKVFPIALPKPLKQLLGNYCARNCVYTQVKTENERTQNFDRRKWF